ncbi:hypothetical protein QTP86_024020 [Hemibagrus guttatus]|nr:hypothetical protein QTP86_024020 [Hemibagrus guttatus]
MATFPCRVILLDGSIIKRDLEKKAVGQVLFDKACEYLDLIEKDYFGLAAWDSSNNKVWLELSKQVRKQIISHHATFTFSVKFYPPDPTLLAEDITRYLLCLQLRTDILTSRLPCPSDMLAVLGSYTIQSEFGDYNPELHGKEIFSNNLLAPNQTPELEEEVAELHRKLKSMSPAEADQLFLQNVKTLPMYGVHLHPAKDASGGDVKLGVCADGLVVCEDEENTQFLCFSWPTVLNMSYKRSNFQVRIFHSEDASENTIKFSLPSYRACKCLWKNAVEHHAFFRNSKDPDKAPKRLLHVGSRFRFDGLTHAESLEASSNIKQAAPRFARSAIKRKAKESRLVALKRPNRTEFVDWFQLLGSEATWPTYSPDTDILESAKFQHWKLQADDWFVLLEPPTYHPNFRHWKTQQLSLQSSQAEEQTEELECFEKNSEKGIEIVRIEKEVEAVTEQHEELEMERNLISPDTVGENLELEIGDSKQILKVMREKIEEVDGEELQTVVMYEQRRKVVESYTEQSQEAFVEQRIRGMEVVDAVHELMLKTGEVVSEENIEELEEKLQEVESIEQTQQDIERLKLKLQEVEMLEQQLQQVQQAGRQRGENDDWYILLERKLLTSLAPVRLLGVKTSEKKLQQNLERGDRGDWYLLLDRKPLVVSSANAELDVQSSWVNVVEEHQNVDEETKWSEDRAVHVRETQLTLPVQREEQTEKQVDDDWFIQLDVPPKEADVHKETREEEVQLVQKQVKTITFEEERREMLETSHEVIEMKPIPYEERDVPSGPTMDTAEQKADIRQWIEEKLQRANSLTPVQMKDDWYILLDLPPQPTQSRQPALPPSVEIDVQSSWVNVVEEHKNLDEETKWSEERAVHVRETQLTLPVQREEQTEKQVDDDWFIQLDVPPKEADVHKETREEEVQLVQKQVKTITFEEERREMLETSHEVIEMKPIPYEKRDVPSAHSQTFYGGPTIDTAEQKAEIRRWIEGELQRANTLTPVQMKDDWYILLDLPPRPIQTRQPALPPSEEHKNVDEETKWSEDRAVHVRETQLTLPVQREEQTEKQVDDDWFIQLDVPPKEADVHKETREEEVQLVQKQVKTITFEEERREMLETSHEVIEMKPIPYEKRDVPSGPTIDTAEQKAEIRRWIEGELQRANTLTPVQMKDDWYILLDLPPRPIQTRQPALPPSAEPQSRMTSTAEPQDQATSTAEQQLRATSTAEHSHRAMSTDERRLQGDDVRLAEVWNSPKGGRAGARCCRNSPPLATEEHKNVDEETKWSEDRAVHVRETQLTLPVQREEQTEKQVDDDWFIQLDVPPKEADVHKETREEEVQLVQKQVKTITFEEERREMLETSHEVIEMKPIPYEKRDVPSGPTMDTAEQKADIRQWIEEKLQRANSLTPVQMKDDWYILLDLPPRPTQSRQPALPPSVYLQ